MILHFVSTGVEFPYLFYLSVVSAKRVLNPDRVYIWSTCRPENNYYWNRLEEGIVEMRYVSPNIPHSDWYDEKRLWSLKKVVVSDYLRFEKLYEYGGMYLDLDTLTLKDITFALEGYEAVVVRDCPGWNYLTNTLIITSKPKTELMRRAKELSFLALENCWRVVLLSRRRPKVISKRWKCEWGDTGLKPISDAYESCNKESVNVLETRVLNTLRCEGINPFSVTEHECIKDLYVMHFWRHHIGDVSPEWIENSDSIYAKLVKEVLTEEEWKI